jgi:RsiW-degrading membrane proteinase PrsW (M82 family)
MNGILILLLLIITSALPVIIAFFLFRARKSPLTPPWFLASLAAGIISLLAAVLVQRLFPSPGNGVLGTVFFGIFIRIALIEEASRLITLIPLFNAVKRRQCLDLPFCAAIGFVSGLGFAMMESAIYGISDLKIILFRVFTATLLHGACGIRAGAAFFTARKHPVHAILIFISAVLIHGAYNLIIVSPALPSILAVFIAFAALFASIHYFAKTPGKEDENTLIT